MEKITSRKNPICAHMKRLGESRSYRYECGQFLCDGIKLLEEAEKNGASICTVLTASEIPFPLPLETRVYHAPQGLLESLSPLKTAQDTLFSCHIHAEPEIPPCNGTLILLDHVRDPGNVGTILRTARAFGVDSVLLTEGCADPYNPKTIRASMGAIFGQKFNQVSIPELIKFITGTAVQGGGAAAPPSAAVRMVGTATDPCYTDISEVRLTGSIVAIGSEGCGLTDGILELCHEMARIPMNPGCESLNAAVAAAIVMWEAHRRLLRGK